MDKNNLLAVLFLLVCSAFDIKSKKIPTGIILVFGVVSVLMYISRKDQELLSLLFCFLPGVMMLAVSHCTKESIGYGDGFIVLVLGLLTGAPRCMAAVVTGFFLTSIFAVILLSLKKVNSKSRIPYVPFLAAGLGVILWI